MTDGAAAGHIDVGSVDEVSEGQPLVVPAEVLDRVDPVVVFRDRGRLYALDQWCSHGMASLADGWVQDGLVECPLHGALFSLADGWPQCPPATEPVPVHRVQVVNGRILLFLTDDVQV